MQKLSSNVKRITVIQGRGPDIIDIELDLASPFPQMQYPATAKFECAAGYGVAWCREVLGLEPDDLIKLPGVTT